MQSETPTIPTYSAGSDKDSTLVAWAVLDCVGVTFQLTLGNCRTVVTILADDDHVEYDLSDLSAHQLDTFHILELYAAALQAYRAAIVVEKNHGQLAFDLVGYLSAC